MTHPTAGGEVKEYEIKTLMDFTKVPQGLLPQCLDEFSEWVGIMREAQKTILIPVEKFTWINDKQRSITVNITTLPQEERK